MKLKITLVFNNTTWASSAEKIQAIKDFYSPDFELDITELHTSFTNIPFQSVGTVGGIDNTAGTTTTVTKEWYAKNISSLTPDADINVFYIEPYNIPRTSVGIMQSQLAESPKQCCIFGIKETDHAYVNGVDLGNCFVLFTEHEISHAIYQIQALPDNTHAYFYSGHPEKVLPELAQGKLIGLYKLLAYLKQQVLSLMLQIGQTKIVPVSAIPVPPPAPVPPVGDLLWDTHDNARHSIRVRCDVKGLNLHEKDLITACIEQESGCLNYRMVNEKLVPTTNKNLNKDGSLSSTDWGICQINDYFHIGDGKDFPSVEFVMANPEKAVDYMINMYKAGRLSMWVSYTSGAYLKYMPK